MALVDYEGPTEIRANHLFKATIRVELEEEIRPGGKIVVAARHVSDIGDAQTEDPKDENFVSIGATGKNVEWEVDSSLQNKRAPWNRGFECVLKKGYLGPGDVIDIRIGGARGFRCQSFFEERFVFWVGIQQDEAAKIKSASVLNPSRFRIVGNRPVAICVYVTDVNSENRNRTICLKVEDAYGNPADISEDRIAIDLLLDGHKFVKSIVMDKSTKETKNIGLPSDGKWHHLDAVSDDDRYFAHSNFFGPSLVDGYHLFWGEMHSHSGLDWGTNSPAYLYHYARKACGLDFAAVSGYGSELTPDKWEKIKSATKSAHRPGEFATFLGYECGGERAQGGDNNVYFLGDQGPFLFKGYKDRKVDKEWKEWNKDVGNFYGKMGTIGAMIDEMGDRPLLVVPHCGGRPANFDFYDAAKMPVLEMYSCHRNFEDVAFEAIERDIKFGFIADGDDHRGSPGDSRPAARERFFSTRTGLIAVYAEELTRESIWEAIFARRVYGTNGCRMMLSFTANGVLMGSELEMLVGEKIQFGIEVIADGWFAYAELVRHTITIARLPQDKLQVRHFKTEYEETVREGTNVYYLRVYQSNGGISWSSPIWIIGK